MSMKRFLALPILASSILLTGCQPGEEGNTNVSSAEPTANTSGNNPPPVFTLAWSEYPSWSVFGVAHAQGLLDKEEGAMGELEKKWNVDVVLKQSDYDTCFTLYGSGEADAVCITNMDALGPAAQKASVAIFPTSTSAGADACVVVGIDDVDGLKNFPTHGLERSVSQYCFERVLEKMGKDVAEFEFKNMDPAQAAQNMVRGAEGYESIMVWNPFVMQTISQQKNSKVLFDSTEIPEEIVDMVVCSRNSLENSGGDRFAYCLLDAFYEVSRRIESSDTGDQTLLDLAADFVAGLTVDEMKTIVTQTKFYADAESAKEIFTKSEFREMIMPTVVDFCIEHDILESKPSVGFDDDSADLNFSTKYIEGMLSGVSPDSLD